MQNYMINQKVNKIINSGFSAGLVITGGGCGVIGTLLKNGGGSNFLKFGYVPYSRESLSAYIYQFLDDPIKRSVCEECVNVISEIAYLDVLGDELEINFNTDRNKIIGVGCSAKLISNGEREGREHKAYVGICSESRKEIYEFSPTAKTRFEQEEELEEFILNKIIGFINVNS